MKFVYTFPDEREKVLFRKKCRRSQQVTREKKYKKRDFFNTMEEKLYAEQFSLSRAEGEQQQRELYGKIVRAV